MNEEGQELMNKWGKSVSPWRDVPANDWQDLRWQLRHLVRTVKQLGDLLGLPETEKRALEPIW